MDNRKLIEEHLKEGVCFACGQNNAAGIHMPFDVGVPDYPVVDLALPYTFQGFYGYIHGGVVTTLMDEAMAHAVRLFHGLAVTARLTVRFRLPLPPALTFRVQAWVEGKKGKLVNAGAEIRNRENGRLIAEAEAVFVLLDQDPGMIRNRALREKILGDCT
jgi:acyl-coenzyme A thioesterase PaaI-like protein